MKRLQLTYVIGIALLFFAGSEHAVAQIFPSGGLPMSYNGGFAGEAGKHRLVSSTQLEVTNFEKRRTRLRQTFSYDTFLPALRSGIGVMAGYKYEHFKPSDSMNWELRNPYFSVAISPKISFKGKWTLAPFVDFQFVHSRSVAYYRPNMTVSPMIPENSRSTIRVGFLLNSAKGYMGLTVIPFERTSKSEIDYGYRYTTINYPGASNTKLILQAGRTFQKKPDSKFSFTPQVAVSLYGDSTRYYPGLVDLNLAFRFNHFHTGFGSGGFQFAYDWDRLRIGTALFYNKLYRKGGYTTFVNGQLTTLRPYQYIQFVSVRYMIN